MDSWSVCGRIVTPKQAVRPEDLLTFIELRGFIDDWEGMKLDVELDLLALQVAIMAAPKAAPVIPGTGGLRKLRFSPPAWKTGKRDAIRVCYVYFEEFWTVLLVVAYPKSQKDNLTESEKRQINKLIDRQHVLLSAASRS